MVAIVQRKELAEICGKAQENLLVGGFYCILPCREAVQVALQ